MFKSIRWKFITIYFLPVYIAMLIIGVFIIQEFQQYHLDTVSENLTNLGRREGLIQTIVRFKDLNESKQEIQKNIDQWPTGLKEEIFVVNRDFKIIARSKNSGTNDNAIEVLDYELLIDARNGHIGEKDIIINTRQGRQITTKNMAFPIQNEGEAVKGILYIRADLSDIYKTLDKSKWILTKATFLALAITVILGYLIARSITEPIIDVTVKAAKMAKGDFNQFVEVKSDDEIGQLAEMFNYAREKLNITLSEISSEKSKLETILSYMADGLIAVNNEGKIIHANPTAMRMLDLSQEDIKNKPYDNIIGVFNERLKIEFIEENSKDWIGSEIIRFKDCIFHANYAPFKDEKGEKAGIVMVIQDITERQKLDNMRKEFVANVSHELKTPLTSIKSYTETLLDGALDDKEITKHFLGVVKSEADRMDRLVRDLLQLSRLDYKREHWNKKETNIVKLTEDSVLKMRINAKNKNQTLSFKGEERVICFIDPDKIEQVIINILSNAIKYTPENGEIKVLVEKDEFRGIIRIIDNGMGIPEKDIPRLFERFYRVDKARSRELGGTGLGLSIAQQIVKAHEGEINIKSKEGEGTEVIIKLPLKEKEV
ncbi:cell wall metabolism sensor histidine kinase WalK [Crassaminicella thermophila]|uniref:histidine kinase n=1 Tax=Crassaminicella thermophila TaxID=2599308 RepID=A0A5C0SKN9_CRATE|nr:ATP-binding protein [Crassaminicella thermophila]QEK13489.1 cell wall metabolism sensor histidine kinase WalK [Crassaminicella thermophila]